MGDFIKEYWLWILIPFVIVLGGIAILLYLAGAGGNSDFVYNVF